MKIQQKNNSKALYESPCCTCKDILVESGLCLSTFSTTEDYVEIEIDWN